MSTIDQLNATTTLSASDLLALYSSANGDTRKISLSTFATWLQTQVLTAADKVTQYAAPLTATTVIVNGATSAVLSNSVWLILTPAGTLAALTIQLPPAVSCVDKQEILVNSTQILTALTWTCAGGTVVGAPTTFAAVNSSTRLRFDVVLQTWYKVG